MSGISLDDLDWKKECENIGRELLKITTNIRNGTYSDIDISDIKKRIDNLEGGDESRNAIVNKLRNALDEIEDTQNKQNTPKIIENNNYIDEYEAESEEGVQPLESPHQFQVHQDLINEDIEQQHWEAVEREAEIARITNTVSDINDIFHDMDTLVNQQGELIDNIEDNIYRTVDFTKQANNQLLKAERYQRRKSRCTCILTIIAAVFIMILILLIL